MTNRYLGRKPSKIAGAPAKGAHRRRSSRGRSPREGASDAPVTVRYECPLCGGPHSKAEHR